MGERTLLSQSYCSSPILERLEASRCTPPQLHSPDLGSPKEVWAVMCKKDEVVRRSPLLARIFAPKAKINAEMRQVLLEWLMEVCADKRLHRETFHLCMDYVDTYLAKAHDIESKNLQLIGITALVLATKMEEIYPPSITDLVDYTDGYCTEEEVMSMEETMLVVLEWDMLPITAIHWLALYLHLLGPQEEANPAPDKRSHEKVTKAPIKARPRYHPSAVRTPMPTDSPESIANSSIHFSDFDSVLRVHSWLEPVASSGGGSCLIPNLMRDEFIRLATVLDLALIDARSLRFKYGELAAALLLHTYEPASLIEEVTGYPSWRLKECYQFLNPFVIVCGKFSPSELTMPTILHYIPREQSHTIQLCQINLLSYVIIVQKEAQVLHEGEKENEEPPSDSSLLCRNDAGCCSPARLKRKRKFQARR